MNSERSGIVRFLLLLRLLLLLLLVAVDDARFARPVNNFYIECVLCDVFIIPIFVT